MNQNFCFQNVPKNDPFPHFKMVNLKKTVIWAKTYLGSMLKVFILFFIWRGNRHLELWQVNRLTGNVSILPVDFTDCKTGFDFRSLLSYWLTTRETTWYLDQISTNQTRSVLGPENFEILGTHRNRTSQFRKFGTVQAKNLGTRTDPVESNHAYVEMLHG